MIVPRIRAYLRALLNSYSETLFLQGYLPGLILLVCTFLRPNVGLAGLAGVFTAYLFALFTGMKDEFLKTGFYTYNPLLVGLSIGFLFKINALTLFFVAAAGILTLVLTVTLSHFMHRLLLLPVLSLPFVVVSSIAYLSSRYYTNLFVEGLYPNDLVRRGWEALPDGLAGLASALGGVFFVPHPLAGLCMLGLLLFFSRILFFLAVGGYFLGTGLTAALTGSFPQAFQNIYFMNFILVAGALGGVFLIPSPQSMVIAFLAVAASPLLLDAGQVFWADYGIPVFTLPFNLITLGFLYFLGIIGYPLVTRRFLGTPERTLDHHLTFTARHPGTLRGVALPFSGTWTVWQGNDGPWTHQGTWRHAFDFVLEDGTEGEDRPFSLEDYPAFGKPVLAPVSGRVVRVTAEIPDNAPGETNPDRVLGNHVVIYDERGFYVVLAHLRQRSIGIQPGQWVERGQPVARCGNSGYSPEPHLHVHVQLTPEAGGATVPFSFVHYGVQRNGELLYRSNHVPAEGEFVVSLVPDREMDRRFTFLLDEEISFQVRQGPVKSRETLKVRMDGEGWFHLDSGRGRLYFEKREGTFYLHRVEGRRSPALEALFLALPRLPLVRRADLAWEDFLPMEAALPRAARGAALFLSAFHHGLFRVKGSYRFDGPSAVDGRVHLPWGNTILESRVTLDRRKGVQTVRVKGPRKEIVLERITP